MIKTTEKTLHIPDTKIPAFDKQYQKIKSVFEQLNACIDENEFGGKLPPVFFNLVYIHDHYFMQEQITLSKYNYEKLDDIKATHQAFMEDVVKYQMKIENDPETSCKEMADFLAEWSGKYFDVNGKAIEFLKEKGIQ